MNKHEATRPDVNMKTSHLMSAKTRCHNAGLTNLGSCWERNDPKGGVYFSGN